MLRFIVNNMQWIILSMIFRVLQQHSFTIEERCITQCTFCTMQIFELFSQKWCSNPDIFRKQNLFIKICVLAGFTKLNRWVNFVCQYYSLSHGILGSWLIICLQNLIAYKMFSSEFTKFICLWKFWYLQETNPNTYGL